MLTTEIGKLLMFGDSITEFAFDQHDGTDFSLGAALQNRYLRRLQVLHRGFSGYTSKQGVELAKGILSCEHDKRPEAQRIKLAYVFFGTNDARLKGENPTNNQHIDIDQYVSNMMEIVKEFKTRSIPLIVVLPTFHDQEMWNETHPDDLITGDYRTTELNKGYGDKLASACAAEDTPVLNLMDAMTQYATEYKLTNVMDGKYGDFLIDGVHFTGLGYQVFYQGLVKVISKRLAHLEHMKIPAQFPFRRDIEFESLNDLQ